jgi:repressor LexA
MALTKRQRQIYDFIKRFIEENGYSPSLEEIGQAFQLSSVATVHKHVTNLVRKGLLRRTWNQNRSIDIVREDVAPRAVEVPILGRLVGGRPVDGAEPPERLAVPSWMMGQGRTYVLRAEGEAMTGDHIRDGDFVVIEERRGAPDGSLVLALVPGEEPRLKRMYSEGDTIRLQTSGQGAIPTTHPVQSVEIRGIVRGVLRRC